MAPALERPCVAIQPVGKRSSGCRRRALVDELDVRCWSNDEIRWLRIYGLDAPAARGAQRRAALHHASNRTEHDPHATRHHDGSAVASPGPAPGMAVVGDPETPHSA
jgi:hypothetical protein